MRKLFTILIMLSLLSGVTACSGKDKDKEGEEEFQSEPIALTMAVRGSSDDLLYHLLETFKSEIELQSDHTIAVTLNTVSELKVDGKEYENLVEGKVDVVFLPREKVQEQSIWLSMFDAWFMFLNYDHYRQTFDDKAGDIMFSNIRTDQNIQVLGTLYEDMKVFNVRSDASFYTIDDFDCLDLGVVPSEGAVMEGKTLGANPVVIVKESINRYLADGSINAYDAYFKNLRSEKFYELTDSILLSEHMVDFSFIAMNSEKWDSLNKEQKEIVQKAVEDLENSYDESIKAEMQEYMDFYKEYGLTIQKINKVEFHEAFSNLYRGNVGLTNDWNIEYYERILKIARKMINDQNGVIE